MRPELILLAVLMAAVLAAIYRRDRRRLLAGRAMLLDRVRGLLDAPRLDMRRDGFPKLSGRHRGHEVRLELTADGLAARKLPSLWLEATVLAPLPHEGVLDYLVRPAGTEVFSPSHWLDERVELPEDWPQEAAMLRTDDARHMPPLDVVGRHLRLFDDPRVKELLVTPRGVRFVYQADEAVRSQYLLLRQARFDAGPVPPALAANLLDAAIALVDDLRDAAAGAAGPTASAASLEPERTHAVA